MASETSDLTFVRCPSCRSLVPASATRCRICNNPLDGLSRDDGDSSKGASARVRQKTITATPEDVQAVMAQSQAASSPQPPPPPPPSSVDPEVSPEAPEDHDPLGAYLQEVESSPGAVGGAPQAPSAAKPTPIPEDDDDLFDLDIFDDPLPEQPAGGRGGGAAEAPFHERLAPMSHEAPAAAPPPVPPAPRAAEAEKAEHQHVRVVAPSAPKPPSASERPRDARPPEGAGARKPGASPAEQPRHPQQPRSEKMHEQRQARPGGGAPPQRGPEPPQRPRRDERDHRKQDRPPRQEPPQPEQQRHQAPVAGPKTGKMRPGRLFGWMVSYENPDGRAIELREGKFFVTSSSIKGSDLILEDPSISTPHALMSISESGLLVQDLMSDHGVFIRSGEERDFRREDGVIRVSHGDWLRFGEVEFLVIVVPSVGR